MSTLRPPHPLSPGPRVRDAGREPEVPSLASWEPLPDSPQASLPEATRREVPRLVEAARNATGDEREVLAGQLGAQLEALGEGGGSREVADLLLHLLESGQLEGLVERGGRTCRSAAVESLTRLGFPYALEVSPEDLEHLRAWTRRRRGPALPSGVVPAGALGVGFVGQWWALPPEVASEVGGLGPFLVVLMGLALMGLMMALLAPERSPSRRAGLFVLLLLSLVEVFLGGPAGYHGAASGLGGLVACLLLVRTRR
ncbi:hypothetical protein [Cystobacter fuscus]|uniref:hypothetical protein n=1 Tax=Cystobacter fuscus TaxID=43 RepID=UPI000686195E|nr:hypothetical protein [Cystobacter fuscus]